ncbi:YihY/virulence factor BrkB family protein [Halobacteriales archaeon QS_6_71_20]|nr:MAG: YihY/virulence factor BrkB family protein [Halobacteriales archaeon QS_6_71_20]
MISTRVRAAASTAAAVVERAREAGIGFLSAAVAYYALASLVPLAALVALAVATVAGETVAERVLAAAGDSLSADGRATVRRLFTGATARSRATLVGLAVLLWGGSRLFRGLDRAFARVYRTDDGSDTLGHARDALVALVGVLSAAVVVVLVAGVVVAVAVSVATEAGDLRSLSGAIAAVRRLSGGVEGPAVAVGLVVARTLLFVALLFPVYYLLPNVPMTVRSALPGTLLTALGWTVMIVAFDRYVGLASGSALSGVAGGVVVVVTLLYVASFLLVAGAIVNAVLAER